MNNISWVAVSSAIACALAAVLTVFGLVLEDWYLLASAGVGAAVGSALSVLSLRDGQ